MIENVVGVTSTTSTTVTVLCTSLFMNPTDNNDVVVTKCLNKELQKHLDLM